MRGLICLKYPSQRGNFKKVLDCWGAEDRLSAPGKLVDPAAEGKANRTSKSGEGLVCWAVKEESCSEVRRQVKRETVRRQVGKWSCIVTRRGGKVDDGCNQVRGVEKRG